MDKQKKVLGIIPARYGSSRFPGKPLANINGTTMIERVYAQSCKAKMLSEVIVATDDERIEKAVRYFGGKVILTSLQHQSGTDRCAEVVEKMPENWEIIVNIQGDEPLIFPEQIDQLVQCFDQVETEIATLIKVISSQEEVENPNVVKVVVNNTNKALYFSRSPIPYYRERNISFLNGPANYFKHIGMYGYRSETLLKLSKLPLSDLEKMEALEQLRWLQHGYAIQTAVTDYQNISVDVPEDIEKILAFLS